MVPGRASTQLGDRWSCLETGSRAWRVPVPPPRGIFHGHLLRGEALAAALRGVDAEGLCEMSRHRYLEFARAQLLQRVSPAASPPQVAAGGSSTQVNLLFWLIYTAFLRIPIDRIFTILFHSQVPARAPVRPRPRALERPQQRPRVATAGEGTSAGALGFRFGFSGCSGPAGVSSRHDGPLLDASG